MPAAAWATIIRGCWRCWREVAAACGGANCLASLANGVEREPASRLSAAGVLLVAERWPLSPAGWAQSAGAGLRRCVPEKPTL